MSEEKKGGSSLVAYAKVGLWEGELEGIIDTEKKSYVLRTVGEGIDVRKIKFDVDPNATSLIEGNEFLKKFIPEGTKAKIGFEYQGNTGVVANGENNSYIRAFVDIEASEEQLNKAPKNGKDDFPFPITFKKLAIGYLKYEKDAEINSSDFRQWLDNEKKEMTSIDSGN